MTLSAILAGLATGIVLGLFGSGGSIVTTPALLYLLDVEPKSAIAMSLGIVALTATITSLQHWMKGNVNLKVTAVFGLFGIFGTYAGARLGVITPVVVQLTLFALVMYAAAWRMLRPARPHRSAGAAAVVNEEVCDSGRCMMHVAMHGIVVGALTGLVGVGGGFLIVPALVLLSRLPMKQAIGTSLAIVAIKSYAGFAGYVGDVSIDYGLMAVFTTVAIAGSVAGTQFAHRISGEALKKGFAIFLMLVATYILANQIF
ncbi:MAG: sulfite exporter TauE/SafE family protein [Gammaproteobacteria bacterium]|nr:sulfite exporter TauE/SafE family protein [Gammaproteobacteria bacterium]MCW8841713.1 sulfite exporter TauE/SafE family protein [Gammaproteobacteria bacterium]MCW8927291.1 sulfite exporter TauE/SafE family protein [Gammaproteobacteria bacterium]MCW8959623.1 sulfite exporter TauE/SafE family protein [Gammaproteobacteria bacterium]MCW8973911.1 sulfite exporter TauE/SafE family protein [Gammaproteobacteria bacterium]